MAPCSLCCGILWYRLTFGPSRMVSVQAAFTPLSGIQSRTGNSTVGGGFIRLWGRRFQLPRCTTVSASPDEPLLPRSRALEIQICWSSYTTFSRCLDEHRLSFFLNSQYLATCSNARSTDTTASGDQVNVDDPWLGPSNGALRVVQVTRTCYSGQSGSGIHSRRSKAHVSCIIRR